MCPVDSAIDCLNNWNQKAIGSTFVEYSEFFSEPPALLTEKKKNFLDNNYPASRVAVIFRLIQESSARNSSSNWLSQFTRKKTVNEAHFEV